MLIYKEGVPFGCKAAGTYRPMAEDTIFEKGVDVTTDADRLVKGGLADLVFFQFLVESTATDAQFSRSSRFVPVAFLQNIPNQLGFVLNDRLLLR